MQTVHVIEFNRDSAASSVWWPTQLRLDLLHQHSSKSDPMGEDFAWLVQLYQSRGAG